jgi:cytidine deaminase
MFHAFAAAARSSSLARQVGAAICTKDGDLVSIGCNEVPKAFGGSYWSGDANDGRDHILEGDTNDAIKRDLLIDLLNRMKKGGWLVEGVAILDDEALLGKAFAESSPLRKAQLMNITEYGRAVHAEMSAISDAAKRGVSVQGCTLFTTTFPCHNCAKHIIGAGIARVVYLEPYPKSFAHTLYSDSVGIDLEQPDQSRVPFCPFVGIAHRQFFPLFQMGRISRKATDGKIVPWPRSPLVPKFCEDHLAYIQQEITSANELNDVIELKHLRLHEDA